MSTETTNLPLNYGVLLFPGFQALDVFGPLDALNILAQELPLNLSIIAATLDPVSTKIPTQILPNTTSTFAQSIVPTHTFSTAPPLDVLIVPGGLGTRVPTGLESTIAFIAHTYPKLRYLLTVCTGSGLAARAGVLDGRRATTNKRAWGETTALGPRVEWVSRARWVVDGNVYTSSGVSAGIDATFALIGEVYGKDKAKNIADRMEYERHADPTWDPFADLYNL